MKKKKVETTIWLDILGFIILPFIILMASLLAIKMFGKSHIIIGICLLLFCLYSFITFYYLLKRKRISFYLTIVYICLSTIFLSYDIIVRYEIFDILYRELTVLGIIIIWLVPNIIYLIKKRNVFKDYHLMGIKKCPGCNRFIPVSMDKCGKCNYKG